MKDYDFDETVLDNEDEFKKRFRKIDRKDRPNTAINKSLSEKNEDSQTDREGDEVIEKFLQDKDALRRLKAALETV